LDRLIEDLRTHAVESCQIRVEHDPPAANREDQRIQSLLRNLYFPSCHRDYDTLASRPNFVKRALIAFRLRSCFAASSRGDRPASNPASNCRSSIVVHGAIVLDGARFRLRSCLSVRSSARTAAPSARTVCGRWIGFSGSRNCPLSGSTPFANDLRITNACKSSISILWQCSLAF
ncbi:MAG: hypothetical protein HW398_1050, partial [Acidobacteria bacterium]|nr:hypothetical protein [Acidobacteriota bacterium]